MQYPYRPYFELAQLDPADRRLFSTLVDIKQQGLP